MIACKPANEEDRLSALYRYDVLDTPVEPAFDNITRLIARICETPIAVINLVDRERQWFKSEIGLGVRETPLDVSICAHAILQPGVFVVPDTTQDERFRDNPLVTGDPNLRFYAGALLETSDGYALGTLCVLDSTPRELTDEQKDALQTLAQQVMSQLELRRLYAREKRVAETLQRAMLMPPREEMLRGLDVEAVYQAAWDEAQVGGDFFDAYTLSEGRVALVVGDVSGKGLGAAVRTANAKFALRVFLRENHCPADALSRLNTYLHDTEDADKAESGSFVALAVAVLDSHGTVTMCHAGIDAPLVARTDGSVDPPRDGSLPLGVLREAAFPSHVLHLAPGDVLMMLTDGLTEARCKNDFLGRDGVERILKSAVSLPAVSHIGEAILDAARAFVGGPFRDDVCLLLARRTE